MKESVLSALPMLRAKNWLEWINVIQLGFVFNVYFKAERDQNVQALENMDL